MNWDTIDQRCEGTPFVSLKLPGGDNIRLWWSKRAGTYGHQVYGFCHKRLPECTKGKDTFFYKTDGCGYSKESHALEVIFRWYGLKPKGMRLGGEGIPSRYHMGGNFYEVSAENLEQIN